MTCIDIRSFVIFHYYQAVRKCKSSIIEIIERMPLRRHITGISFVPLLSKMSDLHRRGGIILSGALLKPKFD